MNVETMRLLIAKGLSAADLLEIAETMDAPKVRSAGAERQARYRARKAECIVTGDVTGDGNCDVTEPLSLSPNEINSNPHTHTPEEKPRTRKVDFVLPGHIPADEWNGYVEMRRRIGKPMTDYAKQLAVKELDKLAADGWPPGLVLNQSTMNSYQGLFAPKDQGKRNGKPPANDRSGASLLERLRADDAAAGLA